MTEYQDETLDSFVLVNHEESLHVDVPSIETSISSLTYLENSCISKSSETEESPYLIDDNKTTSENNDGKNDNLFSQDCPENLKMYNNFELIEPPESISLKSFDFNQEVFESDLIICKNAKAILKNNFAKSLDVIDEMDFRVNILNRSTLSDTWTPNLYIHKNDEVKSKDISNIEHDKIQTNCGILNTGVNTNIVNCESSIKTNINIENDSEIVEKPNVDFSTVLLQAEVKFGSECLNSEDSKFCLTGFEKSVHNIDETNLLIASGDNNVVESVDKDFCQHEMDNDIDHTESITRVINNDNEEENDKVETKDISNIEHDQIHVCCGATISLSNKKSNYLETFDNNKEIECKEDDINLLHAEVNLCSSPDIDNIIDFKIADDSLYKSDDVDFRVNILNRHLIDDSWTPNLYIHKADECETIGVILNTEVDNNGIHSESSIKTDIKIEDDSEIVVKANVGYPTELSQDEVKLGSEHINSENCKLYLTSVEKSVHNIDETSFGTSSADNNVTERDDNDVRNSNIDHTESISPVINHHNESVHDTNDSPLLHDIIFQSQIINYVDTEAEIVRISDNCSNSSIGNESSVNNIDKACFEIAAVSNNIVESDDNYFSTDEMDYNASHSESSTQVINNDNEAVHGTNDSQLLQDITFKQQIIDYTEDEGATVEMANNLPHSTIINESSMIPKPIGIGNPRNFKSMNSVIGMLSNCFEFRTEMIKYHRSGKGAIIDLHMLFDATVSDACFVNDLSMLLTFLTEDKNQWQDVARSVRKYILNNQSLELDVYQGFQYILWKINSIMKTVINEPITSTKKDDIEFDKYKFENHGFISDLFYGQILHKNVCENCYFIHSEFYQPINSISLNRHELLSSFTLDECIKNHFKPTFEDSNDNYQCCVQPIIKISQEITHAPDYLFIYLNRKLDNDEIDHTYFEIDNGFLIETKNGQVLYSLISVIDQDIKHHYHNVKCLTDHWWSIDNYSAREIREFEIATNFSVGFMLKKII